MRRTRLAGLLGGLALLAVALGGGEYGVLDARELARRERAERAQIADLEQVVDSLARWAKAIETDPAVRERIARETFGMVRPGEYLYRFVSDSAP